METSGWLDASPDGLPYFDADILLLPGKSRAEWVNTVKHQRAELTANKLANLPPSANKGNAPIPNDAEILPHDYFNHRSHVDPAKNADIISSIIMTFELNIEQTRAFRIIADHASGPQQMPLKMYLGGMGGTGKSQVFKAVAEFFARRNESYRFLMLGPTGSVAALLNGSTYHSVFKIVRESKSKNHDDIEGIRNEGTAMAAVNERLQGVDYIFLDEISMVSCNDLQGLATQAAKARNIYEEAFGG
ncbi:hypothetical protein C8R43DRAFT_883828, partial [Mycena crocata]